MVIFHFLTLFSAQTFSVIELPKKSSKPHPVKRGHPSHQGYGVHRSRKNLIQIDSKSPKSQ
ncbi:hypothetical protein, partial [Fischerella muscicola]|uniref:hypothetical protein n=1 Tax=Fischerella muscicola TaxID=92938 RepID=UPI001F2FACE0